jgi:septum formation protein
VSLILASASPARASLLRAAGHRFRQLPSATPEEPPRPGEPVAAYTARLARAKAAAVSARHPGAYVIGSDTAVGAGDGILGKAAGPREAVRMLRRLAGRTHRLTTAVCVVAPSRRRGRPGPFRTAVDSVRVTLRAWPESRIRRYVRTVRPFGCAGAYALQADGAAIVARVEGDPATVVGLPLGAVERLLRELGYRAGKPGRVTRPSSEPGRRCARRSRRRC